MPNLFTANGTKVSNLTIGTWGAGTFTWGEKNRTEMTEAFNYLINHGVNSIDTARMYGDAEVFLSDFLKDKKREDLFIFTKCGRYRDKEGHSYSDATYENIISDCEKSLRSIQTDYIDLLMLHWPDHKTPIEESLSAFKTLQKQGKIRLFGISNFQKDEAAEAYKIAKISSFQGRFNMIDRPFEDSFTWAKENDIFTMSYGTLGAGILTGSFQNIPKLAANDSRRVFYDYFSEEKFGKIQELIHLLEEIGNKYRKTVTEVTLKWNSQHPLISTCIVGVRKLSHAKANIIRDDWQLSADDLSAIEEKINVLELL